MARAIPVHVWGLPPPEASGDDNVWIGPCILAIRPVSAPACHSPTLLDFTSVLVRERLDWNTTPSALTMVEFTGVGQATCILAVMWKPLAVSALREERWDTESLLMPDPPPWERHGETESWCLWEYGEEKCICNHLASQGIVSHAQKHLKVYICDTSCCFDRILSLSLKRGAETNVAIKPAN